MAQQQQQIPQLFGLIPTGHAPILVPSSAPSQTSFVYTIPVLPSRPFSHVVVFLLPGIELPPNTAAAVYLSLPPSTSSSQQQQPTFKFLGGIGPGKESAIFKISGLLSSSSSQTTQNGAEVDMDAPEPSFPTQTAITIGISLEPSDSVSAQIASLHSSSSSTNPPSSALVLANTNNKAVGKPDTLILAQRIIKNAFNFLASFSGNVAGGCGGCPA